MPEQLKLQWLFLSGTPLQTLEGIPELESLKYISLASTCVPQDDPTVLKLKERGVEVRF